MKLKGVIFEDFINYKKPCMVLEFPYCTFKCDKECGKPVCQNGALAQASDIEVDMWELLDRYVNNPITEAVVFQGLEPFNSYSDMCCFISALRHSYRCYDDIVIYTGFTEDELRVPIHVGDRSSYPLQYLENYPNIIVKFGRYIPDQEPHYDEVLGVKLASDNQYAVKIS